MGGHAGLRSSPEEMESESCSPGAGYMCPAYIRRPGKCKSESCSPGARYMCPAYEDGGMNSLETGVRQSRYSVRQICLGRGGGEMGKLLACPVKGARFK